MIDHMSLLTDIKYINLVSNKLLVFKKKTDRLYNFRCPFCLDSNKNKYKARGYLFEIKGSMVFKCHNCNLGASLSKILNTVDPSVAKQYQLEKYQSNHHRQSTEFVVKNTVKPEEHVHQTTILDELLIKISKLPATHRAVEYLKARQIPKDRYDDLYYASDMKKLEVLNSQYKDRLVSDERIVIPFRDQTGQLTGVTGRALGNSSIRYVTVRMRSDPMIYGLDRLDKTKPVYIVEGPIDSMFVYNAIAAGGTDFNRVLYNLREHASDIVLVFDNQPRNKQVVSKIESYAAKGFPIVIWDQSWSYKDINEAVVNGKYSQAAINVLLNNLTRSGLALRLAIRDWKKC